MQISKCKILVFRQSRNEALVSFCFLSMLRLWLTALDVFFVKLYNSDRYNFSFYMAKTNIRGKIRWGIFGILALIVVSSIFVAPGMFNRFINKTNSVAHLGLPTVPEKDFRLGLDLQGGAHLVYEADTSNLGEGEKGDAVEGVRDVIERRVNGMGVGEPQVQTSKVEDSYRLIVELPGVTDVQQAIAMIGGTPILEFKEENNIPARELTAEERKELDDYNSQAKQTATEALNRVKGGENFETVVNEVSQDTTSKNNGGYLNYIGKNSAYFDLYEAAQSLKEGKLSNELVENREGYNILKRGAERDGGQAYEPCEAECEAAAALFGDVCGERDGCGVGVEVHCG